MARGLAADASWRRGALDTRRTAARSAVRVALVTAVILLVPLVVEGFDWSLADFIVAGALLAGCGLLLELIVRKPRNLAYRAATIAIGVASILFGGSDDAPGLVLFGGPLIIGTVALALRAAPQRSE